MDQEWRSNEPDSSEPYQKSDEQHDNSAGAVGRTLDAANNLEVPPATAELRNRLIGAETAAEDLAEYILRALVDDDTTLRISCESIAPSHVKIVASCDQANAGRLIGRGGKTINALRTLARSMAQVHDKRVDIEIAS